MSQVYTVKAGDTLSKIASSYDVPLSDILAANPSIKNPNVISVGQKIEIPVPPASEEPVVQPTAPPSSGGVGLDIRNRSSWLDIPIKPTVGYGPAGASLRKACFDNVMFMFNPEQIEDEKGNVYDYTTPSNMAYPIRHFVSGKIPTLNFTLYVNEQEEPGSVDRIINKLNSHLPFNPAEPIFTGLPPKPMIFSMGTYYVKKVYLITFRVVRKTFHPKTLKTTEAEIDISLEIEE